MSANEAKALPGGRVAIVLFWLGASTTFVSALLLALSMGAPGFAEGLHSDVRILPAWGLIAITLAVVMRRSKAVPVRMAGAFWLLVPLILVGMGQLGMMDFQIEQP